ncbi:MAG TPA: hypothetical protein P5224_13090 [Mesotoga sp.]|nr:hypothetical protein [Mesotoga sp.]
MLKSGYMCCHADKKWMEGEDYWGWVCKTCGYAEWHERKPMFVVAKKAGEKDGSGKRQGYGSNV